jgi:phage gp29-like protein
MNRTNASPLYGVSTGAGTGIVKPNTPSSLSSFISPVQLNRIKFDVRMWRECIAEAEYAYFPYRVKMQQLYIDTILNGHVASLMERRHDLTMLRKFNIEVNGQASEVLTQQFEESEWFEDFQLYALDAEFFGYSLIELGDIKDDEFKDISIVRRWNVSPDRKEATDYIYQPNGHKFEEEPFKNWHIYVPTRSENGVSKCGYGLFYKIALYEIFLRNTLGFNGDFVELYSQPYRLGKTTKTSGPERDALENAIKNMGSSGWAITDPSDDITFLETALGGTGYKGYESLESRCQKIVSKLVLGHADAVDSTPGKLGSGQGSKDGANTDGSPVAMALADKQAKDGRKMQRTCNNNLFPKLKALGLKGIPDNMRLVYANDAEQQQERTQTDAANLATATVAYQMKQAGLQMTPEYYQKVTGIPTEAVPPPPAPVTPGQDDDEQDGPKKKALNRIRIRNKLNQTYK